MCTTYVGMYIGKDVQCRIQLGTVFVRLTKSGTKKFLFDFLESFFWTMASGNLYVVQKCSVPNKLFIH
jgi:hypothetical protein